MIRRFNKEKTLVFPTPIEEFLRKKRIKTAYVKKLRQSIREKCPLVKNLDPVKENMFYSDKLQKYLQALKDADNSMEGWFRRSFPWGEVLSRWDIEHYGKPKGYVDWSEVNDYWIQFYRQWKVDNQN